MAEKTYLAPPKQAPDLKIPNGSTAVNVRIHDPRAGSAVYLNLDLMQTSIIVNFLLRFKQVLSN
ncbi:hypothetical protein V1522DRAFT_425723 [Lipomyces starkeyi]